MDNDIPVPYGDIAYTEQSAIALAEYIGYPVVVKPYDGNQGKGVALNLSTREQVREAFSRLPVIGVEPALKPAHDLTQNGKIGVLATSMTLNGIRFSVLVERFGTGVEVFTQPAPGLVELVEDGKLDTPETGALLHQYLDPLLEKGIETLVLGGTH